MAKDNAPTILSALVFIGVSASIKRDQPIFTYIWLISMVNISKCIIYIYDVHGSYGSILGFAQRSFSSFFQDGQL